MSEIRYGKTALPECCRRIGERLTDPYQEHLYNIYARVNQKSGESFSRLFCEEMQACMNQLPITAKDKEDFLLFATGGSYEEGKMQLRTIERSYELLHTTTARLEKDNIEKCRIAVGLGAMSGLLLIIILI